MQNAFCLLLALPAGAAGDAGLDKMPAGVLVECEEFALTADWRVEEDPALDYSGEGYVSDRAAPGFARPPISRKLRLPREGEYHIWVRAYLGGDPAKPMHDRALAVEVNGRMFATTHRGRASGGFVWELAGSLHLDAASETTIRLHDQGRSDAMVDCLLLTDDTSFRPAGWSGNSRPGDLSILRRAVDPASLPEASPYTLDTPVCSHVETIDRGEATYEISMDGTLDGFNTADYPATYGYSRRLASRFEPNEFVVIENIGETEVVNPRIVVNGRRNWYSVKDILDGIITPDMTDAEKAMAIWQFAASYDVQCHENNRRVGPYYPDEASHPSRNTFRERGNPVYAANCYYCSGCQLSATNFVVLCRNAGLIARAVWMSGLDEFENHCVGEVRHDGGWHLYDPEARAFFLNRDNQTVASYQALHEDPGLVDRTRVGGFARDGGRGSGRNYEKYFPQHVMPVEKDWVGTMEMTLRPGEKLIRRWDHRSKFRCGANPRNRNATPYQLANGKWIYRPVLTPGQFWRDIVSEHNIDVTSSDGHSWQVHPGVAKTPALVIYKISSPYPIVGAVVGGNFFRKTTGDVCRVSLSVHDSDWLPVWSAATTGPTRRYVAVDQLLLPKPAPAIREFYVKIELDSAAEPTDAHLTELYFEADVQMAATSLPALSVGANRIVYCDDSQGKRAVKIRHGWQEGSATRPPLAPPSPIEPTDGATVTLSSLGTLTWKPARDLDGNAIGGYHIQVSPREDFLHPVSPNFDSLIRSGDTNWDLPGGWLVPGKTYYWRLRARDDWGAWSGWSSAWRFTAVK